MNIGPQTQTESLIFSRHQPGLEHGSARRRGCRVVRGLHYQKRISGPLSLPLRCRDSRLDRIDIHPLRFASGIYDIEVPRVDYEKLAGDGPSRGSGFEPSAKIRERVERARDRQRLRFSGTPLQCNGDMGPAEVRQHCGLDDTGKSLLRSAMSQIPRPERRAMKLGTDSKDQRGR